jgi:hypothetical protein
VSDFKIYLTKQEDGSMSPFKYAKNMIRYRLKWRVCILFRELVEGETPLPTHVADPTVNLWLGDLTDSAKH